VVPFAAATAALAAAAAADPQTFLCIITLTARTTPLPVTSRQAAGESRGERWGTAVGVNWDYTVDLRGYRHGAR